MTAAGDFEARLAQAKDASALLKTEIGKVLVGQGAVVDQVLWAILVLILPVIGVIIYFIARPPQPTDRGATLDPIGDESLEPIRRRHGPA